MRRRSTSASVSYTHLDVYKRQTQEEYEEAVNTPVETVKTPVTSGDGSSSGKKVQSWFVDAVIEQVIKDLAEKYDYTSEHAEEMLYTGGLTVYSTMEIETQSRMEAIFENSDNFKVAGYTIETMPQASMVIMDYDGNVCGLIGGTGEKTGARLFNRATVSYTHLDVYKRQPVSLAVHVRR